MKSILITGCNRGIGLGLVQTLLNSSKAPTHLITTCRDTQRAQDLREIANKNSNVSILELDVKKFECYGTFAKDVESIVGEDGLNVLWNNAGVSSKFTRLPLVKLEQLTDSLFTNTIAPIMLTKALYPVLQKAAKQNQNVPMGISRAAVLNMSSVLGSIAANVDGGYYPYRCSKAALNMASRSMSADFRADGILVVSLHPGWVQTAMGGPKAPTPVHACASQLVQLLPQLNETHNGAFLQFDGTFLDW